MEADPEVLLTKNEIELVCKASKNPIFRHPDVVNFGNEHTTIYKVTIKNALILIKGNKHTGFEHIHERHDFFSFKHYWKEDLNMKSDYKIRLDNPSKFSSESIPIIDYLTIADEIFNPLNLNIVNNKRPDIFDIYEGAFVHTNELIVNYRLLLYKDSKIIHSLFPTVKVFNREKIINYVKGIVTANICTEPYILIKIPYKNDMNEIVFCILIRKYLKENREECFIEAYDKKGCNILTHRIGERLCDKFDIDNIEMELLQWQLRDLTKEEKIIKQLDKKIRESRQDADTSNK